MECFEFRHEEISDRIIHAGISPLGDYEIGKLDEVQGDQWIELERTKPDLVFGITRPRIDRVLVTTDECRYEFNRIDYAAPLNAPAFESAKRIIRIGAILQDVRAVSGQEGN